VDAKISIREIEAETGERDGARFNGCYDDDDRANDVPAERRVFEQQSSPKQGVRQVGRLLGRKHTLSIAKTARRRQGNRLGAQVGAAAAPCHARRRFQHKL
jgi:hypothetical protein